MMEVEGSLSDDENRNLFAEDETQVEEERNNPDDYAVEVPSTQQGLFSNYQYVIGQPLEMPSPITV